MKPEKLTALLNTLAKQNREQQTAAAEAAASAENDREAAESEILEILREVRKMPGREY